MDKYFLDIAQEDVERAKGLRKMLRGFHHLVPSREDIEVTKETKDPKKDDLKSLETENEKLNATLQERDNQLRSLRDESHVALGYYKEQIDTLKKEKSSLQTQLTETKFALEDVKMNAAEITDTVVINLRQELADFRQKADEKECELQSKLQLTEKQLAETMQQMDQDYITQMAQMSCKLVDVSKDSASNMSEMKGEVAGLKQEIKMLLDALDQKDFHLRELKKALYQCQIDKERLSVKVNRDAKTVAIVQKEYSDAQRLLEEQQGSMLKVERLSNVHRSQVELLQRHIVPKDRELRQAQEYVTELHSKNQEIMVQATVSDRLRVSTAARSKRIESEAMSTQRKLDNVRHSVDVLLEELGELVRQSTVKEKSSLVGEIVRIHKRISRERAIIQGQVDGEEDQVSAELHRQNNFLLKNKQHLRRQMELAQQGKHKLASALSHQNASLISELNSLKKQNKELERRLRRYEKQDGHAANTTTRPASAKADRNMHGMKRTAMNRPMSAAAHTRRH